ncbi:MAG: HAMP domain-containing sensor histidine kinase [Pseudomonadota bacterium]|nr:HAMP domain-containing sensor histidine kinase [Pseudomonadota bacterium]
MKFYRPKSILHLILIGFSLVALPLIVALVIATVSVDRLVSQSQHTLLQSVLVTQGSQVLVEAITAMERNARQYQVLGDKVLFDVYEENHTKFVDTARTLEVLELEDRQRNLLDEMHVTEDEIHVTLATYPHDAPETTEVLVGFTELAQTAQQILLNNQDLISRGVEQIQGNAEKVQRTLAIQAIALVPAALLLTVLFTVLITRPINQIDRAIHQLGDGQFNTSAIVTGPRDLEQLGERLGWLRNRLLELEQEKTRFIQHISHELKTPLTAIREGTELMNEQVVGDLNNQQREIVGILRDNSQHLQKLIEDLLNFSIMRTRASTIFRSQVELKAMIEVVLEDHKVALLSRKLDLQLSLQPFSLNADREKLRILVDNLISNAIKYSPDGGSLRVMLFNRDDKVIIEVADSGPGIPDAERERVFEAFYQGAPADKGHVRGTGLGLSIAMEYAQAHGGKISVVNSGGAGACFQVVLPLEQGS